MGQNITYQDYLKKLIKYDRIRYEVNELLYQLKQEAKIRANNEITNAENTLKSASEFVYKTKTVSSKYGGNGVAKLTTLYEKAEYELKTAKEKLESEDYIAILEAKKTAKGSYDIANSIISESKELANSIIRTANIEKERNREIRNRNVKDALSFCFRMAIVLGIIFVIVWYNFGPPNQIYTFPSQQEFEKYWTCSGSCIVRNGYVELSGTMTLKTVPDFGAIEVTPIINMPNPLTISVGHYYFEYSQGTVNLPWIMNTNDIYNKGTIYYYNKGTGLDYVLTPVLKVNDLASSIKITSSWWSDITDRVPGGDPAMYMDGRSLVSGTRIQSVTPEPVQGAISISGQNANIQEVKIYHGSIIARIFG